MIAAIQWCNENQGFCLALCALLSLMVSVVAVVISLVAFRKPDAKALSFNLWLGFDSMGHYVAHVALANIGAADICIKSACLIDKMKSEYMGSIEFDDIDSSSLTLRSGQIISGTATLFPCNSIEARDFSDSGNEIVVEVRDYSGWTFRKSSGNSLAVG